MYHSITIGNKNTYDDWHLISTSRILVNPPSVKTSYVDLPGGDGSLDLTEVLGGRPTYNNRTGSWTFYVLNGYQEWYELYSDIMEYLQGKELDAVLEDDPAYAYHGRFQVDAWRSDPTWSKIVISYNVGPYKMDVAGYGDNWLWDPFNFERDVIKSYKNLVVNGSLTITYINDTLETVPSFTATASGMTVIFKGETFRMSVGYNKFPRLIFDPGDNELTFTGNGKVTIENIGGKL